MILQPTNLLFVGYYLAKSNSRWGWYPTSSIPPIEVVQATSPTLYTPDPSFQLSGNPSNSTWNTLLAL
jgi:hypothetical protein